MWTLAEDIRHRILPSLQRISPEEKEGIASFLSGGEVYENPYSGTLGLSAAYRAWEEGWWQAAMQAYNGFKWDCRLSNSPRGWEGTDWKSDPERLEIVDAILRELRGVPRMKIELNGEEHLEIQRD